MMLVVMVKTFNNVTNKARYTLSIAAALIASASTVQADCFQQAGQGNASIEFKCSHGIDFKAVPVSVNEPAAIKIRLLSAFDTQEFLAKYVEPNTVMHLVGQQRFLDSSRKKYRNQQLISLYGFVKEGQLRWISFVSDKDQSGADIKVVTHNLNGVIEKMVVDKDFVVSQQMLPQGMSIDQQTLTIDDPNLVYAQFGL